MTTEHKLDNMRKEFVANVFHELKTPITTIKNYAETLMEKDIDKKTEAMFLDVIDNECDRMARLVKDLLQLSNLDYEKTIWKKEDVNIKELINNIIIKLEFQYKEKKQNLVLNIEKESPNILIDKDGVEQVIINIISNSIKYTEENGEINVKIAKEDNNIVIKIIDNGIGIPGKNQNRIFERFYRVEKGRSRDLGGTGLGLSIAEQIIESHNGEINLKNSFGEGTTVEIRLPYNLV